MAAGNPSSSQSDSQVEVPGSLCLPVATYDFSVSQLSASSVPCHLPPVTTSPPASSSSSSHSSFPSSSSSASVPHTRENRSLGVTSLIFPPSFSATAPFGPHITTNLNSRVNLSSLSPASQSSSPHLVDHSNSSPHVVAISSFFSTSASSCEVDLDSPFSVPPTPPPSPAFDNSQSPTSYSFIGIPALNLPWSINAECFSSTAASAPSSPYSSCTSSVATRDSSEQRNHADATGKRIPHSPKTRVSAMSSPKVSQVHRSTSPSNVNAGFLDTVNCNNILHTLTTTCNSPVKPPSPPATTTPGRHNGHFSPFWSYQTHEKMSTTFSTECCSFLSAEEPFLSAEDRNTAEFDCTGVVHPCGVSSHPPLRIDTGQACHRLTTSCPAASVSFARCLLVRHGELSRAPFLLCTLILLFAAFGVALLWGISGGWWPVLSLYLQNSLTEKTSVLIYSNGAAYAGGAVPYPGLAVSTATGAAAEPASPTRLPEEMETGGRALEQTPPTSENHAEATFRSTSTRGSSGYSRDPADKKGEPSEQWMIQTEGVRPDSRTLLEASRSSSKTREAPAASGVFLGGAEKKKMLVDHTPTAPETRDSPFVSATISDFLTKTLERLKDVFLFLGSQATASTILMDFSPASPVEEAPPASTRSSSYLPERRSYKDASDATIITCPFLSRPVTLTIDWIATVGRHNIRSLRALPFGILILVAVSVCCCFCSLFLSGSLVYKHLKNYYEPHLQRYVCRVCLIAPAFAVSSIAYFVHTLPRVASGNTAVGHAAANFSAVVPAGAVAPSNHFLSYSAAEPGVIAAADTNALLHAGSDVPWTALASATTTSVARQEEVFIGFLRDLAQAVALYSFLVLMTNCCGGDRCISLTVACNPNKVSPVPPLNFLLRPFHPGPHVLRYLRIGVMQCVLVVPLVGVLSLLQALSATSTYASFVQENSWLPDARTLGPTKNAAVGPPPDPDFFHQASSPNGGYPVSRLYKSSSDVVEGAPGGVTDTSFKPGTAHHVAQSPLYGKNPNPIITAAQRITDQSGHKSMLPVLMGFGIPWRSLLLLCSVTICMFSLLQFYMCTESLLRPYKPLQKFISIKFLVFFQVWQKLAIHVFLHLSIIQVNDLLTPEDTADLYHNVMMSAWTVTVSISHLLCFPLKDHLPEMPQGSSTLAQPGATLLQSMLDVFLAVDVLHDARDIALVQHPSLDRACSLLLDQSVEANRDGLLAACTTTPEGAISQMDPSPISERVQRLEELSKKGSLSSEDYNEFQHTSHPAPVHSEHPVSEAMNGKHEVASSPSASSKTVDREQQHTTTIATTEPFVAPSEPPFYLENNNNTVVVRCDNEEEDAKPAAPVRVVINHPTVPEEAAAQSSTWAAAQQSPLYRGFARHAPQHLHYPTTQASSHALLTSVETTALLLPQGSLSADTPLHLRHVTPSSDSQTVRSAGRRLWGMGDIVAAYSLSGSPLTMAQSTRQHSSNTAAAAAAAAVAAATSRTPLSATAKAAAAARFVLTSGANSPFHDCPAAALAAALGDFDPSRNFTSVAVTLAASKDSDDDMMNEGEEGGVQRMQEEEEGKSVPSTQSSGFLRHPISAYTSSSSSSSSSTLLTDRRIEPSQSSSNGDAGSGNKRSLGEAGVRLKSRRRSTSDSGHGFARRKRSWSDSLLGCGCQSQVQRTDGSSSSDDFTNQLDRRRRSSLTLSAPSLEAWDAETGENRTDVCNLVSASNTDAQQRHTKVCHVHMGSQPQQGAAGRHVTRLFNWARQSWACRRIPALSSNAREALALFNSNLRTVTNTSTSISHSFPAFGPCRQASAVHGIGSEVHAHPCSNDDTDFACGWGVEGESQEVLMQALAQQQQLWASSPPAHSRATSMAERFSKDILLKETRQNNAEETAPSSDAAEQKKLRSHHSHHLLLSSSHLHLEEEAGQTGSVGRGGRCLHEQEQEVGVAGLPSRKHETNVTRRKQKRQHRCFQGQRDNNNLMQQTEGHTYTPTQRQSQLHNMSSGVMKQLNQPSIQRSLEDIEIHPSHTAAAADADAKRCYLKDKTDMLDDVERIEHQDMLDDVERIEQPNGEENESRQHCHAPPAFTTNAINLPAEDERTSPAARTTRVKNAKRSHQEDGNQGRRNEVESVSRIVMGHRDSHEKDSPDNTEPLTRRDTEPMTRLDTEALKRSRQSPSSNNTPMASEESQEGPISVESSPPSSVSVEIEESEEAKETQLPENCVMRVSGSSTARSVLHPATLSSSGCVTCSAIEGEKYDAYSHIRTRESLQIRRIGWSVEAGEEEEQGEALGD